MEIVRAADAACDFPHIECVFNYQQGDAKAAAFAQLNARLAKWQNGKMVNWPNGRMVEWPNGKPKCQLHS